MPFRVPLLSETWWSSPWWHFSWAISLKLFLIMVWYFRCWNIWRGNTMPAKNVVRIHVFEIIFPSTYFLTNFNHWFGFRFLSFLHFLVNFWSGILFKRWSSRFVGMLPPKFPPSFGVFRYINSATSMPRPFAEKWSFIVIAVLINVVGSWSAI